ncbi:MAG: hypothetical protein ACK4MQ_10710 [Hyphomonas sp.]
MAHRVEQDAPVSIRFHLAVLDKAVRFLEAELLGVAQPDSFAAQEAQLAAEEARESIRLLAAIAARAPADPAA